MFRVLGLGVWGLRGRFIHAPAIGVLGAYESGLKP